MPFDGTLINNHRPLADTLKRLGIRPIQRTILDTHMTEQQNRYPASWCYNHRDRLELALFIALPALLLTIFDCLLAIILGNYLISPVFAAYVAIVMCGVSFVAFGVSMLPHCKLRGPAFWDRRALRFSAYTVIDMPPAVKMILRRLADSTDTAHLRVVYGELRREFELLDPFISVRDQRSDEEYVIGIWDGDTILHIATME